MTEEIKPQNEITCPHCGHKWEPRVEDPKYCPMCKRPLKKVSSKTQVIIQKTIEQKQMAIVRCENYPDCPHVAVFEGPDGKAYCVECYREYLATFRQPTEEELLQTAVE